MKLIYKYDNMNTQCDWLFYYLLISIKIKILFKREREMKFLATRVQSSAVLNGIIITVIFVCLSGAWRIWLKFCTLAPWVSIWGHFFFYFSKISISGAWGRVFSQNEAKTSGQPGDQKDGIWLKFYHFTNL